jgi:hypothetical protein
MNLEMNCLLQVAFGDARPTSTITPNTSKLNNNRGLPQMGTIVTNKLVDGVFLDPT